MTTLQLDDLEENGVYAALYTNEHGKSWHWAIYFHRFHYPSPNIEISGYKMHATNTYGPWQYERTDQDILSTHTLTTITKIGAIHDLQWGVEFLETYLKAIPMSIPRVDELYEKAFTCRVWFREAIRVLHNEGFCINCSDVNALCRELISHARLNEANTMYRATHPLFVAKAARAVTPDL